MGISSHDFLQQVIQPTLRQLGIISPVAEQLLLATAYHQSRLGEQLQSKQGLGVFAITPEQHTEVWDHYLAKDCELASQVRGMASQHEFPKAPHSELIGNLRYATAIAWMLFQYHSVKIPDVADPCSIAHCWQAVFGNPSDSSAETEHFARHYHELMEKHAATRLAA